MTDEDSKPHVTDKGAYSYSTYTFTHIEPERLRLPNFSSFPWDTDMMRSSEVISDLKKPFTALACIESFRPKFKAEGASESFRAAFGAKGIVTREGTRVEGGGHARASSFLTAYRIVDIHHRLEVQPTKTPLTSPIDGLFEAPLAKLNTWPKILIKFQHALEEQGKIEEKEKTDPEHSLRDFASALHSKQQYSTICLNITLAVLHLRAMFDGSSTEGIPDIPDEMMEVRRVYGVSQSGASGIWNGKFPARLRNPLQASALVTPIVLLLTNRLDNMTIKKDFLTSVFKQLGNSRPAVVRALEDKIWRTLFTLADNPNATSSNIHSSLEDIGKSKEFLDAVGIEGTDAAYLAFGGPKEQPVSKMKGLKGQPIAPMRGLRTTQMPETPTLLLTDAAAESPQAMNSYDEHSKQLGSPIYSNSDNRATSSLYHMFNNAGSHVPQATRAVENDGENPCRWTESHDVDMPDAAQHDSSTMGDLDEQEQPGQLNTAHLTGDYDRRSNQPSPDVEMGLGLEDSAREEDRSGEGTTWDLPPGRQTSAPPQGQAGSVHAAEKQVCGHPAFFRQEQGGAPSNDDDEVMGEEADNVELQRGVGSVDETESEDEHEASPKMGEDGAPTDTDSEGDSADVGDGSDEAPRRSTRMEALHMRPTASSVIKSVKQPIRHTSRRSKIAKKFTKSHRNTSKPTIEDEDSADADATMEEADGSVEPDKDDGATEEEKTTLFEQVAEGIWIKTRHRTLDSQERPKIQRHVDIDAYGFSEEKIQIRVSVHDKDTLDNIELLAEAVKESYRDGIPLHIHPTAHKESIFYLVKEADFEELSDKEVQNILRQRHIVIHGCHQKKMTFKQALQTLGGGPESMIDMQDQSLAFQEDYNKIRRVGTIGDLLKHANSSTGNALNALDFPMHHAPMTPTSYASDAHALRRTADNPTWDQAKQFPAGDFRWGLAATTGAFHTLHIDSNGLGSYVSPQAGSKWWVVARPIGSLDQSSFEDMGMLLNKAFSVNGNGAGLFALEAVLLEPGTTLIMRPNTIHAVYTPQSSVVHGGHFFATSTMRDTLAATFHTSVLNELMTNTDHPPAYASLRRLIDLFHCALVEGKNDEDDPSNDHIPDLSTINGLVDFLSICTLGMLLSAIDIRTYGDEKMAPYDKKLWDTQDTTPLPLEDRLANQYARGQCTELLMWADDHFTVIVTSQESKDELTVTEIQRQLFTHHAWLLQCYANSADKGDFSQRPNFNGPNLKTQLTGLQKYCINGSLKKEEVQISQVDMHSRRLFPFLDDGVAVRPKPEGPVLSCSIPPTDNSSKVKRLLSLGRTDRDALYEAFSARIKSEKTETEADAPRNRKKRKF